MLPLALVRQYAVSQQIDVAVADQEVVLHYALALLNTANLIGTQPNDLVPGPLLFKGGTALRKCVFGSSGRFSQDIDLDATHRNGFEADIEAAFAAHDPYHGIHFSVPSPGSGESMTIPGQLFTPRARDRRGRCRSSRSRGCCGSPTSRRDGGRSPRSGRRRC